MERKERLSELMRLGTLDGVPAGTALQWCGELIDLAMDLNDNDAVEKAIDLLSRIEPIELESSERVQHLYFQGNAWALKDDLDQRGSDGAWHWNRPAVERAIIAYRRAVREPGFAGTPAVERSRVLTNLANAFVKLGRFVLAGALFGEASDADPSHGMPRFNRGVALKEYTRHLHDPRHHEVVAWHAHQEIDEALALTLEPGVKDRAEASRAEIRRAFKSAYLDAPIDLVVPSLGVSAEEVTYRKWCLANRLFVNPLNDCLDHPVAARDALHLPSIVRPVGEGPGFHGFFNQMKQEYAAARFLLFASGCSEGTHYSDRKVKLVDTLDYPCYGLAVEKMRLAFRMAFAVLDKVSVFVATYLGLGGADFTSFRSVWYRKGKAKFGLRPEFEVRANWPLRGLFWLSKDLYRKVSSCGQDLDPDAVTLREIRNKMEHGYLKVVESVPMGENDDPLRDHLAMFVSRDDLAQKALRLLSHAREALIYCSLAVGTEEMRTRSERDPNEIMPPSFLDDIDDEWKV